MFKLMLVREAVLNPDGSITLSKKNISVSEDQSDLTVINNITLLADTMFILLLVGGAVLNPDGSYTMPEKNISVSRDQSILILTACITLPIDTVLATNVEVLGYTSNKTGGRLISGAVNSGTSHASQHAQMVREFNLEKANVTLTSKLTKNHTTNLFQVESIFRIGLPSSTLYHHSPVIRKIVVVVTSYGKENLKNEQLFSIFYPNSGEILFCLFVFLI